jgi:hypothetical protein
VSGADNQQESLSSEDRRGWFLAGLVEGEGSACVSLKEHPTTASGYYVQPCFFIYQHSVRRALLEMAKEYFGCGSIYPKPGNPDGLVYAINSRRDILHAVVPFLQRYRGVLGTPHRLRCVHPDRSALSERAHWAPGGMSRIVRLAYSMNLNGKQRKRPLDEVLDRILRGHTPDAHGRGR